MSICSLCNVRCISDKNLIFPPHTRFAKIETGPFVSLWREAVRRKINDWTLADRRQHCTTPVRVILNKLTTNTFSCREIMFGTSIWRRTSTLANSNIELQVLISGIGKWSADWGRRWRSSSYAHAYRQIKRDVGGTRFDLTGCERIRKDNQIVHQCLSVLWKLNRSLKLTRCVRRLGNHAMDRKKFF